VFPLEILRSIWKTQNARVGNVIASGTYTTDSTFMSLTVRNFNLSLSCILITFFQCSDMYCSPNIIRVIRSRIMRLAGHVAYVGVRRGAHRVLVGNLRKRDHLEEQGIDGRIILRWIFRMWHGRAWAVWIWLRIGTGGGLL